LGAPAEVTTTLSTWSDGSNVNTSGATWSASITEPTGAATACSASAFSATSYGNPASTATNPGPTSGDIWKVNEVKLIQNTQVFLGN
jgi:hypothetical protein